MSHSVLHGTVRQVCGESRAIRAQICAAKLSGTDGGRQGRSARLRREAYAAIQRGVEGGDDMVSATDEDLRVRGYLLSQANKLSIPDLVEKVRRDTLPLREAAAAVPADRFFERPG